MSLEKPLGQNNITIPVLKFSTESFKPCEQFNAWCDFTNGMSEIEPINSPGEGFHASSEIYQLGSIFMTNYAFSPLKLKYSEDSIRRSRLDHWCLGIITQGNAAVDSDQKGFSATQGDLVLYSYAKPFAGKLDKAEYSSLFFSRDEFWDIADELDQASQLCISGPLSRIIGDFLLSVKGRADMLSVTEAAAVNEAFASLVRAMVRQTPSTMEAAKEPIAAVQFDQARRFIAANLKSPELTPDTICARVGLSRRKLYYLFQKHGGVANFIKNRRLAECHKALSKSNERKFVSSIAYEYGFTNLSSFYRQFQERYGFRPSEARSAHINGQSGQVFAGSTFVDWLMRADVA